jgi:hypothetical protein
MNIVASSFAHRTDPDRIVDGFLPHTTGRLLAEAGEGCREPSSHAPAERLAAADAAYGNRNCHPTRRVFASNFPRHAVRLARAVLRKQRRKKSSSDSYHSISFLRAHNDALGNDQTLAPSAPSPIIATVLFWRAAETTEVFLRCRSACRMP